MKLWSKGLGTKTLVLDLAEGKPCVSPDGLLVKGTIKVPVWWDYTITMTDQDLIDILKVAVRQETVDYLQTVPHPWKVLGIMALSMGQFFVLWVRGRAGIYARRLLRRGQTVPQPDARQQERSHATPVESALGPRAKGLGEQEGT